MYINNIDSILDNTLDDFYGNIVEKKKFSHILKLVNFIEKREELMSIIYGYVSSLDLSDIKKNINDNQHVKLLTDMIQKYIFYYAFVLIGFFYNDNMDVYKNNVVEISKVHDKQKYNITGFFTSESNSNTFMLTIIARDINDIVVNEKKRKDAIKTKYESIKNEVTRKLLMELGDEVTETLFTMLSKMKTESERAHAIIKIVLIKKLYFGIDKSEIVKIMENENMLSGETIYIDIVIPLEKSVDIVDVESVLTKEEIEMGVGKSIYDIITKGEIMYQQQSSQTPDSKIIELINDGLIVPISEDFMLYHKDSEKYDNVKHEKSKHESSRIKYILDKITTVENYYSDVKNEGTVKQLIYTPLANRFAVTMNENEDLKIISKQMKYGNRVSSDTNFFDELVHYRKYPYINFKDFKKDGFPMIFEKTKTVVRSVSLEKKGEFHQQEHNQIQLRIGSNGQIVNIVGFMFNNRKMPLECMRVKHIKRITTDYDEFIGSINQGILTGKSDTIGWMFDLNSESFKATTYEQFDKMEKSERCKLICAKMRDDIIDMIYKKIINVLNSYGEISFYNAFKIVNIVMKNTLHIHESDPKFIEIKKLIYYKLHEKYVPQYDKKDDMIFGLYGETLKLPSVPVQKPEEKLRLHIEKIDSVTTNDNVETISGIICQHFVTWSNILSQRKLNDVKYVDMLYEFMQTFVIENEDTDYLCKSCGSLLDIKKYVSEGSYDSSTNRFVPYSIPMNVSLEDLPEYKRYNIVIRNVDSLINRIAENINIPYLVGSSLTYKINRTTMVKDTIDLVLLNNAFLRKNFKERNEKATKIYGINRDLSNLFAFELDNGIFLHTPGKEKDYYKYIKHNNIVAYILFLMLLELDESHISLISKDKMCNYKLFAKFSGMMFENLKLRINDNGDTKNISEYPVLCYMIYVATCILSKYPIWYHETEVAKKKISPIKQKIMIHTLVDVINCVSEYASENISKHIYEIIHSKYNNKLATLYSRKDVITRLAEETSEKISISSNTSGREDVHPIILTKPYEPAKFSSTIYLKYVSAKFYPSGHDLQSSDIEISNRIFCKNGLFHIWKLDGLTMKCTRCQSILSEIKTSDDETELIKSNMNMRYLEKIGDKYCLDGRLHSYEKRHIDNKTEQIQVCKACQYMRGEFIPFDKLEQLEKRITEPKLMEQHVETNAKQEKYNAFVNKIIGTLKGQYTESKTHRDDYYKFIEKFIETIQQIIGDTIRIDEKTINLKEDTYIIDHNHLGYPIEPPIVINEHSKMISFKKNNAFFKRDVIIYNTGDSAKIDVFYDMRTYILLGYKEFNKDYVTNTKTENKIKVELSLMNKIKYLGTASKYIDVSEFGDVKESAVINNAIGELSRKRIGNIGNVIYKFLVYINMIKMKKKISKPQTSDDRDEPYVNLDIEKYYRKLMGLITKTENTKVFKLWSPIVQNIHYRENQVRKIDIDIRDNMIMIDDVFNYDYSGNLILYYFISELSNLIDINKNKFVRQNLIQLMIEFIGVMYKEYNTDYLEYINEIQRFKCMINSSDYFRELEEKGFGMDEFTTGIYGEYTDPNDVKTKEELAAEDDAKEESEALDVDNDIDAEDDYDNAYDADIARVPAYKWEPTILDNFTFYN